MSTTVCSQNRRVYGSNPALGLSCLLCIFWYVGTQFFIFIFGVQIGLKQPCLVRWFVNRISCPPLGRWLSVSLVLSTVFALSARHDVKWKTWNRTRSYVSVGCLRVAELRFKKVQESTRMWKLQRYEAEYPRWVYAWALEHKWSTNA